MTASSATNGVAAVASQRILVVVPREVAANLVSVPSHRAGRGRGKILAEHFAKALDAITVTQENYLWDVSTGREIREVRQQGKVLSVAFGGNDGVVAVWPVAIDW